MHQEPQSTADFVVSEEDALSLIVPTAIKLRLWFGAQSLGDGFSGPLNDMMVADMIYEAATEITMALAEWLPYVTDSGGGAPWSATLRELLELKTEREINARLVTVDDKRKRTLMRMAVVVVYLCNIEDLLRDGKEINSVITRTIYKKIDDALRGFLLEWHEPDLSFGPEDGADERAGI